MSRLNTNHRQTTTLDTLDAAIPGVGEWSCELATMRYRGSSECCRLRELFPKNEEQNFTPEVWWRSVHQVDKRRLDSEMDRLYTGQINRISVRYRVQNRGERWRWILTRANVVRYSSDSIDSTDRAVLIRGVDMDVTELYEEYRDNEVLREEAERSEIALSSAQQGLWQVDFRLGIRTESDTWRTMRGYSADGPYSSDNGWHDDIHPDDFELVANHDFKIDGENDDNIDYSYRQRNAKGEWRWIWSRGKVIQWGSDGRPLVLIGTDTDITQIKQAETRFERLSNTLEIAIKAAGMGVWEWTLNAQVNVWDRRTREIFGIDIESERVPHSKFMELVYPDDRKDLEEALRLAVHELSDINVDYRINHSQKGIRFIKAKAQCHSAVGEATRYVGIVWDITDMIHAEQERTTLAERLSHAQRLQSIGELTGGIAHDFNNLLAVITGNAELLSMTSADENRYLNAILTAAQRGAVLTRGLLAFSRKQALQPTSVCLGEVIGNLCAMLHTTLGSSISINSQLMGNLWLCEADPVEVENALINLIVNARDAMPKGGTITIDTENCVLDMTFASLAQDVVPGDFVKVSVIDTGTGMSSSVLSKSIDPFFTTKTAGDGHGLGLSMVFGFMKQSNGHMTIESVTSQGTTVSLYLPRYRGNLQQPVNKPSAPDYLSMGEGETILLVEDDASVQDMIEKTLSFLGYQTICVSSAAEALEEMTRRRYHIDLVVSDIMLAEGMNGFELGQVLSTQFPESRIVFISGYAPEALRQQSANNQNVNILEKPFSVERLAMHIAQRLQ